MKILSIVVMLFCGIFLSIAVFAGSSKTVSISMYEKPEENSKKVASLSLGSQLIPFFYTERKDWVKVANPSSGDVGWVKASELKGPIVITKVIISGDEGQQKQPQVYQYCYNYNSSSNGVGELNEKDAKKLIDNMEKKNKEIRETMHREWEEMHKNMQKMFQQFDKLMFLQ